MYPACAVAVGKGAQWDIIWEGCRCSVCGLQRDDGPQLGAVQDVRLLRTKWPVGHTFGEPFEFYGTSENAVKTQIWIAVSVYVLVAIVRKRLGLDASLYHILQILSVTLFEQTSILQALQPTGSEELLPEPSNQLNLFNL